MSYQVEATGDTPAYIIYLIDASGSMEAPMPQTSKRKIDVVSDLLVEIAGEMFRRSRRGRTVSNRYRIALYVYGNSVEADTQDQFIPINDFVEMVPEFDDLNRAQTNTRAAFTCAFNLLESYLPQMQHSPAPMICHITDGKYTEKYGDPADVVAQIMRLRNSDGNVLIQNVYIGRDPLLRTPVTNVKQWPGVQSEAELSAHEYAQALYNMSSKFPVAYTNVLRAQGYNIMPNSSMLFPTESSEMIRLAFAASGATGMNGYVSEDEWEDDLEDEWEDDLEEAPLYEEME